MTGPAVIRVVRVTGSVITRMSSDRTLRRRALEASRNQQFLCESESDLSDFWNSSEPENDDISVSD